MIQEFDHQGQYSSVEDTYAVKSAISRISPPSLPLLDDGELRAGMLEQVEDRVRLL